MASKIFFTLMALCLFIAVTVSMPFDDSEEEGFNVLEFMYDQLNQENAFEEMMEKRGGKGNGGKGKKKYVMCDAPMSQCICDKRFAKNNMKHFVTC